MLSKERIQDLNAFMIGEGAPIEKDYAGYSKPDYCRMYELSHIIHLDDFESYAILETLNHYKNRQLLEQKDEIEDTMKYYQNLLGIDFVKKFANNRGMFTTTSHKKEDFTPSYLTIVETNDFGISVNFGRYIDDSALSNFTRSNYNQKVSWKGKNLFIPWNRKIIDQFISILPDLGRYGYRVQEFSDAVDANFKDIINEQPSLQMKDIAISILSIKNDILELASKPAFDSFKNLLWNEKNNGLKISYIYKTDDVVTFRVPITVYSSLLKNIGNQVLHNDYWSEREKIAGLNISWVNEADVQKVYLDEQNAKLNKNKSINTLVDVSTLSLPFAPYDYQLEDANEVVAHKRMLLGHEMGCGKTFISVLVGLSIPGKKLVVVPESLRLNWKREILNVSGIQDVKVLYSKDSFEVGNDWTIVGYKTAQKFTQELITSGFSTMFVDEAHYCKSVNNYGVPNSARAKAIVSLSDNIEHVYLLTGTPMPTRNKDLYNLLKMIHVSELEDKKFFDYGVKFCAGFSNGYGWDFSGSSNREELHELLSKYMVRRLKSEVLPNLKKQRQFIPLNITSKKYFNVEKKLKDADDDSTFLGLCQTGRRILSGVKVKECIDFADTLLEAGESVVIVSEFNETIEAIETEYADNCCKIVGGMSDNAKQQAIDDFQSGKYQVCVVNMMAAGVGITLTKSHNMIICDFDWTPANMVQVEDRICRVGQNDCCNIYYMYGENTIMDTTFVNMISDKSENIDRVVDDSDNTMNLASDASNSSGSILKALMKATGYNENKNKKRN